LQLGLTARLLESQGGAVSGMGTDCGLDECADVHGNAPLVYYIFVLENLFIGRFDEDKALN
jgi:hypothetical protein